MQDNGLAEMNPSFEGVSALQTIPDGGVVRRTGNQFNTALAVTKPRNKNMIVKEAEEEGALLADDAYYAWGEGQNRIEGPSVKLAMCAARIWGNCAVDCDSVQDLADSWIFTGRFIDLEKGTTITRQHRQSKSWVVHGKHDAERKMDMRFQIGQSKCARNVILNSVPSYIVDRMISAAKNSVRGKIEEQIQKHGIEKVRDQFLKKLGSYGVTEQRVLSRLEIDRVGLLTADLLTILSGAIRGIETRETTALEAFPEVHANGEAPKSADEAIRAAMARD